jgi:hypothetical protein
MPDGVLIGVFFRLNLLTVQPGAHSALSLNNSVIGQKRGAEKPYLSDSKSLVSASASHSLGPPRFTRSLSE